MIQIITAFSAMLLAVSPGVLIPAPVRSDSGTGTYILPETMSYSIVCKTDTTGMAAFRSYMEKSTLNLTFTQKRDSDLRIVLGDRNLSRTLDSGKVFEDYRRESAYSLLITPRGIEIKSSTVTGAFWAVQSLLQLSSYGRELEECQIVDWPRLKYRGLMLDISRNFRDKEFIKRQMDVMALLKLNKLHLHLTDDAGWRIQIDSHPLLTEKAAWRIGNTWREWRDFGQKYSEEGSPLASGGYLTKSDVRELVAYASERHIEIIPEFEIPGHSREVLSAYPDLACTGEDGRPVLNSDMCPCNPRVMDFIDDVISELAEMFPSEYIHIGGDEASRSAWKSCPRCREVMEKENIYDVAILQSRMAEEVEKIVERHGRNMIGWDEIMEGGIPGKATVMSWRGEKNGLDAIAAGHDVVMCPNRYYYLDYTQDAPILAPNSIGGYIPLELAYSYNADIDSPHLIGVQGNVWTEFISDDAHMEYMLYPRAFAVAETGWSRTDRKDYQDFRQRTSALSAFLRTKGYTTFDIDKEFGDRPESYNRIMHLASGKSARFIISPSEKYMASGAVSVTDGLRGTWSYSDGRWMGFSSDMDVVIDLETIRPVHYVGAAFMAQRNNYVGLPERVEVFLSEDGVDYTLAGVTYSQLPADTEDMAYVDLSCLVDARARYVRFKAFRRDMPFHDWLFTDEIVVK